MHGEHGSTGLADPWRPHSPSPSLRIVAQAPYHHGFVEDGVPTPPRRQAPRGAWVTRQAMPGTPARCKPALDALCQQFAPAPPCRLDQ
jgi:hypothetical protein